jgi:5-formyltetrahydrofolate cyclo-ligase
MVAQLKKNEVRREVRLVLANLDPRWEQAAHGEVCSNLSRLITSPQLPHIQHVLAWIPAFPGEVDLSAFIGAMLRSRVVYLPRIEGRGVMRFHRIDQGWAARLERTDRGIAQPEAGYGEEFNPFEGEQVAIVAPGLAFDRRGRRLGRGGGYYDRFLDDPRIGSAIRIGVCWSMQLLPEIPVDPHDVAMDWICHERGVVPISGEVRDE